MLLESPCVLRGIVPTFYAQNNGVDQAVAIHGDSPMKVGFGLVEVTEDSAAVEVFMSRCGLCSKV